jgi:extracellular factor (EF) 3-hydroxypalmitic acid methyl ester biosynthesis protein
MQNRADDTSSGIQESSVICQSSQGVEFGATLLRLSRYLAVLEIYDPGLVLRVSEVLTSFKIVIRDRTIYSGRAVVSSLVNAGSVVVCEVRLDEGSFNVASFSPADAAGLAKEGFDGFLRQWQKVYRVTPEFKVVVADMQTFLGDLRLWLDQVELEIRSMPTGDRVQAELETATELGASMVPAFNAMHERFEAVSAGIATEFRPVHQSFAMRQLHPLVLCSPFGYRTFHKPLGYAGDYEMVNMIARDPYEGGSLYAKLVNLWFLKQWPAEAHRNRIKYLKKVLTEECLRGERRGRPIRILNLGCGPAREIQEFLAEEAISDFAQFTLWDFNNETIEHSTSVLESLRRQHGRRTQIQFQKKSVHQVLKEGSKPTVVSTTNGKGDSTRYDLIYCAGLFDYLTDRTCKQLTNIFYNWLAPGGKLAVTNVHDSKPFRHMLEFVLDWHLIYRDASKGRLLLPDKAPADWSRVENDSTAVNVFIETRKPDNG